MILPVDLTPPDGDRRPAPLGPVVQGLIAACVLVFLVQLGSPEAWTTRWAHVPGTGDLLGRFTHQFLHGGVGHLVGNMLFLWTFGRELERRWGSAEFLALYLGAGLVASLVHDLSMGAPVAGGGLARWQLVAAGIKPVVGASGAISGVMGAALVVVGAGRVTLTWWVPPLIWGWRFEAPAWLIIGLGFGGDLWNIFLGAETGVAHWAHLGGAVAGILVAAGAQVAGPAPRPRAGPTRVDAGAVELLAYARRLYLHGHMLEAARALAEARSRGLPADLEELAADLAARLRLHGLAVGPARGPGYNGRR